MATLRCYPGAPGPILPEDDHGECTVTYTVTQSSTAYRYVVTQLSVKNLYSVTRSFPYSVKLGSTTYASGTVSNVAAGGTKTVTLDVDGRVYKGSSTQAGLTITASVSGISNSSDSNSTTVPPAEYAVMYDANGGSGAPSVQTKVYGQTLTLSSAIPTRADYSFWHWNTSSTNSGTSYNSGASYTANESTKLYAIWNPRVYYNANGGTGAPATQTKTYGQTLTLSSTVPTRSGYRFNGWNTAANGTGTNYAAGASYTSNSPVTLYAKWQKEPNKPAIPSLSVIRVDSNGNQDDAGGYGKVTVTWSVDLTSETVGNHNSGTLTGFYVASGAQSTTSLTWDSGSTTTGSGGTATATFPADTDKQYAILVTVTDGYGSYGGQTVSRADILTRAEFVMDFRAGGKAIGIGSAAPEDGLLIGWDTEIIGDLDIGGKLTMLNPSVNRDNPDGATHYDTEHCFEFSDADDETIGRIRSFQLNNGTVGIAVQCRNEKITGEEVANELTLSIARDGTRSYYMSSPSAFRSAIGISRTTSTVTRVAVRDAISIVHSHNNVTSTLHGTYLRLSSAVNDFSSLTFAKITSHTPESDVWASVVATTPSLNGVVRINPSGNVIFYNYSGVQWGTDVQFCFTATWAL